MPNAKTTRYTVRRYVSKGTISSTDLSIVRTFKMSGVGEIVDIEVSARYDTDDSDATHDVGLAIRNNSSDRQMHLSPTDDANDERELFDALRPGRAVVLPGYSYRQGEDISVRCQVENWATAQEDIHVCAVLVCRETYTDGPYDAE